MKFDIITKSKFLSKPGRITFEGTQQEWEKFVEHFESYDIKEVLKGK